MAKFINLWEIEVSKMPSDPKETAAISAPQIRMIKKLMAEGKVIDWGMFPGGLSGYTIAEQDTAADVLKTTLQFAPYVRSYVHPVVSIDELEMVMKSMSGQT